MVKKISFFSIFALGINSIIGAGIVVLPANAYAAFGHYSLFSVIFTTGFAFLFAMCFAELAGIFSRSGGVYIYTRETLGDFLGFQAGMFIFFSATMTWTVEAVAFKQICSTYLPIFQEGSLWGTLLPSILIFLTAGLSFIGVGTGTLSGNITAVAKLLPLFIFCIIGIFFIHTKNIMDPAYIPPTHHAMSAFSSTVLIFFYAFSGFEMVSLAAGVMKDSKKNIPKALISVLVFVGILYTLILFICIGVLGPALGTSKNPLSDTMAQIVGPIGFIFIWAGSLISIFGQLIAAGFEGPYALSALAKTGFLPKRLAISSASTPKGSIIFMAVLASLISLTGTLNILLESLSLILLMIYLLPAISVMVIRKRKIKSTFQIPFYPITPILTIVGALYLIYNVPFIELMYGIVALIISLATYFLYSKPHKKRMDRAKT